MTIKPEDIEKYSSAITLSDMEIFVFPELMYSLVLANIMSPIIWQWRRLDCFRRLENKDSYRKLMRLRQFVMDEYEFNLDLETWGLTDKNTELKRFEKYISAHDISRSNALFSYHGDEYYFDVDIRRHFGLDKYDSNIIPYWKTETIEAMNAFRLKTGYEKAAGECVSLSALYAAAAFIVCGIALQDIYMILTPLHSQNFIDIRDSVLTNNRRLVTKTMWFNGTPISNKAQRALRNEQVTIVAHSTGWTHCLYNDVTINPDTYTALVGKLGAYLSTDLSLLAFASFLRANRDYQRFFQVCRQCHGEAQFIKAEVLFHYEHGSNYKIADRTHEKLLAEVNDEDFVRYELPARIRCDKLNEFLQEHEPDLQTPDGRDALSEFLAPAVPEADKFVGELADFLQIQPKLPTPDKNFIAAEPLKIDPKLDRDEIIDYLRHIRRHNATADLAFYAYRDMTTCDWLPFVKAALERNPVSIKAAENMSLNQTYDWLQAMKDASIYDGNRLAQPDEVANYHSGDGLEKALLLANVIRCRNTEQDITITVDNNEVVLRAGDEYRFASAKGLEKQIDIPAGSTEYVCK